MKRSHTISLYAYYALYFLALGITSFNPKYMGEIGMSDSQIGIIMSVPGIIGILFQSSWGILADRVRLKRNIVLAASLLGGVTYLLTGFASSFWLIFMGMTLITLFLLPINPICSTIALEHTEKVGLSFGPIRMSGTIGYQIGALAIGFILFSSLKGMFQIIGVMFLLAAVTSVFLPPVQGHQHGKEKKSFFALLKDRRLVILLIMNFVACTTSAFYMSFFTKHLGDLGIDNGVTGIITVISITLEIPFLILSKRLYKKLTIWHFTLIGLVLNGVRWIGLGLSGDVGLIILSNIPAVSIMACFEFFPALYINEITSDELKGSAQSLLSLTTFGFTKITGGLLGGFASSAIGIPSVFIICGILLLTAAVIFIIPCKRLIASERNRGKSA